MGVVTNSSKHLFCFFVYDLFFSILRFFIIYCSLLCKDTFFILLVICSFTCDSCNDGKNPPPEMAFTILGKSGGKCTLFIRDLYHIIVGIVLDNCKRYLFVCDLCRLLFIIRILISRCRGCQRCLCSRNLCQCCNGCCGSRCCYCRSYYACYRSSISSRRIGTTIAAITSVRSCAGRSTCGCTCALAGACRSTLA